LLYLFNIPTYQLCFNSSLYFTSLYPGITVLLARLLLGERLRWLQRAGLMLAAVGVVLVTV